MDRARVLILHKNRLFRESLAAALAHDAERTITAGDVAELEVDRNVPSPDVAILDIHVMECDGMEVARHVRSLYPDTKIIVLGVQEEESAILSCFEEIRAAAYLLDNASLEELHNSIRALMVGEVLCSPRATAFLVSRLTRRAAEVAARHADERFDRLTKREMEIVELIDAGRSNKEIAQRLFIEVQTVKNHVHNILNKLKVHGRRELALYSRDTRSS